MSSEKRIHDLPDEILVAIFSYLNIEDLALNIRNVCHRWRAVVQDSRIWRSLKFRPVDEMAKEDRIIEILKGSPSLRWPVPWYLYTRKILETLIDYCKDVRELYISEVEDNLVRKLVRECPNVESLEIDYFKFETTKSLDIISECKNLKHVKLSGYGSNEEVNLFQAVAIGCPLLESFNVQYFTHYASNDLVYFLQTKGNKIRALSLRCCFFHEEKCIISSISFCTELEALTIDSHGKYEAYNSENEIAWNTTDFIIYFVTNPVHKLKKLDLLSFGSFDKQLANAIFENCVNLQVVHFEKIKGLTDECLESIFLLRSMTSLICDHCSSITDRGVSYIVKCTNLKLLSLMGCTKLTNTAFVLCFDLRLLEKLVLNVPRLYFEDIIMIPELLKNLKYLHISGKDGIDEVAPNFFKQMMPKLNLVISNSE
ncbi:Uncharacterized protein GBIM_15118 [Gryllus bimaculatus]|nr:Uncharacterized protein GBIM_15118 [Gryllus bimaculatus]